MKMDEIKSQLIILIEKLTGKDLPNINLETNLSYDVKIDSLELVQLVVMIETQFNIEFDDNDFTMDNLSVFGNLCHLILNKTQ
jgi:acyl carrier protein